jgi:hemerythrin
MPMLQGEPHALGHAQIDEQHRAMMAAMKEVQRRVAAGDLPPLRAAVASLWDASVANFATEEALMEANAYPELRAHTSAHHLFLEDVRELLRQLDERGLADDVATWALQRVPEWITFHIETNDAPLTRFLARRTAAKLVATARGNPPPLPRKDS